MTSDLTPTEKQRRIVELLTANTRTSLNRCWRHVYGSHHNPSIAQLLKSPVILHLFREALAAGRTLPRQFEDDIMAAIAKADLMALR
jgi:hypothetical protein